MLTDIAPRQPRRNTVKFILTPPRPVTESVHALEFADRAGESARRSGFSPQLLDRFGGAILHTHRRINAIVISVPADQSEKAREALAKRGVRVEESKRVYPLLNDTVPALGAPRIWELSCTGASAKCAVLDTGIDQAHPDFAGRIRLFKNFSNERAGDQVGHGTHVAGIIGGAGEIYRGVAPGVEFVIGKVLGMEGGDDTDVIAGLSWAADQGAQVINLSLGGPGDPDDALSRECDALAREGILVCVAAGNSGPERSTIGSPGNASGVITVGAADKDRKLAYYSSRGPVPGKRYLKPDIICYGGGVDFNAACMYRTGIVSAKSSQRSVTPCDEERLYTRMSGTSMATPHVTGVAALLLDLVNQHQPKWSAKKRAAFVKKLLKSSAVPLEDQDNYTRWDTGAGMLDPLLALAALTP